MSLLSACSTESEETRELMKEAYINSRLSQYEKFKTDKCEELIIIKARKDVDEEILRRARELTNDNLDIFNKPNKPEKPPVKQMKDTLKIAPLVTDSIK